MRYITNHTRHKKQNSRNITSHFWKSFSCDIPGHWEITWENRLQNLCSLIWPLGIGAFGNISSPPNTSTVHGWTANILQQRSIHTNVSVILVLVKQMFTVFYSILRRSKSYKVCKGHRTVTTRLQMKAPYFQLPPPKSPLTWQGNG